MKIFFILVFLWAGCNESISHSQNKELTSYLGKEFSFLKTAMQKIEAANDKILKDVHTIVVKGTDERNKHVSRKDDKKDDECKDRKRKCSYYVKKGYCQKKAQTMKKYCPKSCKMCNEEKTTKEDHKSSGVWKRIAASSCRDKTRKCSKYLEKGFCQNYVKKMKTHCSKTCGFCTHESEEGNTKERDEEEERTKPDGNDTSKDECVDVDEKCQYYQNRGYCQKREENMKTRCAKTCGSNGDSSQWNGNRSPEEGETVYTSTESPDSTESTWDMYTDSKLIVATSEEIFEYDFPSESWKRHEVAPTPRAIFYYNNTLAWVSRFKTGVYFKNFEAETMMKLEAPIAPVAMDRDSGIVFLRSSSGTKKNLYEVDLKQRNILKNIGLPSSFSCLNAIVKDKKLHMIGTKRGGLVETTMCLKKYKMYHTKLDIPMYSNATLDPFKGRKVLYVTDLHLMEHCIRTGSNQKLADIPGPIVSMQVNNDSILLVGYAEVYIYNRTSSEVKTLPRPANMNNNFRFGLIYKKPKDVTYSGQYTDETGSGDWNGTSSGYENGKHYSGNYGDNGDYVTTEHSDGEEGNMRTAVDHHKEMNTRQLAGDNKINPRTRDIKTPRKIYDKAMDPMKIKPRTKDRPRPMMQNDQPMPPRSDRRSRIMTKDAIIMNGEGTVRGSSLRNRNRKMRPEAMIMDGEGFAEQKPMSGRPAGNGVMRIKKKRHRVQRNRKESSYFKSNYSNDI